MREYVFLRGTRSDVRHFVRHHVGHRPTHDTTLSLDSQYFGSPIARSRVSTAFRSVAGASAQKRADAIGNSTNTNVSKAEKKAHKK